MKFILFIDIVKLKKDPRGIESFYSIFANESKEVLKK
jgi:hypothetical protein